MTPSITRVSPVHFEGLVQASRGDDAGCIVRNGIGMAWFGVERAVTATAESAAEAQRELFAGLAGEPNAPTWRAFASIPFERGQSFRLVLPQATVISTGRHAWIAATNHDARRAMIDALTPGGATGDDEPDEFTLTPLPSHDEFKTAVNKVLEVIASGQLTKAVLARHVRVETNRPIRRTAVLSRLATLYPSTWVFSVGDFLGASPELLVARHGSSVRSQPLAGTVAHSGDPDTDRRLVEQLLGSTKDRHEHQVVVDAVAEALAPICGHLEVPETPSVMTLRNVSHLGTEIRGRLRDEFTHATALDIALRLHPTPAVGGVPTDKALDIISQLEPMERSHYAGPLGWVDAHGDGEWVIGLRSAHVQGNHATLHAGVGIVHGSEPQAELVETQLKLQALLAAIVRP